MYTRDLRQPYRKKSNEYKSGDRAGQTANRKIFIKKHRYLALKMGWYSAVFVPKREGKFVH